MVMFKTRDDVDEYNDLLAEVARLSAIIGDQQILLDEHRMDNRHAFDEGGHAERAAVVAWLRDCALDPETTGAEMRLFQNLATTIERGEHRREETK